MTSHELAKQLLEKPDAPVVYEDRSEDLVEINSVEYYERAWYFNKDMKYGPGPVVKVP